MDTLSTESTSTSDLSAIDSSSSTDSSSSQSTPVVSEANAASADAKPSAEGQPAPYTPSWKFKVKDKEHEIPEFVRPAVTSAEHEKQLKEVFEKAFGLDEVKSARERVREEYKSYRTQTEPVVKTLTQAAQLYNGAMQAYESGNVKGAVFKLEESFKHLGIPDKVLQQYVFQKLQMEELPPDLKADYNRQRELELQYAQMQQQMQEQQSYFQQMAVQTRTQELQQATSRPDVAPIIQAFDQRNGPGSFHQEVIQRGQLYWQTQQVDVPAEQLVQEIINKYGLSAQQAAMSAAPQAVESRSVPVIPSVKGGGVSAVKRKPTSIADIEKEYNSL